MFPSSEHDKLIQNAPAAVQEAASRFSQKDKVGLDQSEPAACIGNLQMLQQQLNELCDKAVAEIRASLERTQDEGG